MCLIWNLIKAFTDTQDDNKKDNNDLEDWQKRISKKKRSMIHLTLKRKS